MAEPKLFISYSWSSPAHEQNVIQLATELRESGIDVILDKWDLKEGHDAIAFMEQMVNNPDIKKVAILTDKTYAEKADGRDGGVGTETQIISTEVYSKQDQDKFVAVIMEKDNDGNPYVPTYYKSRIHIDLCDGSKYNENFEKLVRWVFNKPLNVKPEIGKAPSYITGENTISLGTTACFKRTVDAIKNGKTYASGSLDEYLKLFAENLEKFRINEYEGEFDDEVINNIESFIPYRNEFIELIITINQYDPSMENMNKIHSFFENIIHYMFRPENMQSWRKSDFDNFRFVIHELFLYTAAIFIKFKNFALINHLLEQKYYLAWNPDYDRNKMIGTSIFNNYLQSFEDRNQRLNKRRTSLRADYLKERCIGTGIDFNHLMQADFVIFMRDEISGADYYDRWYPHTLVYLGRSNSPFEIFARSISKRYFDKVKVMLAIDKPEDLTTLLSSYKKDSRSLPRWNYTVLNPEYLLNYDNLAKEP